MSAQTATFCRWVERETGFTGVEILRPLAGGNSNVTNLVRTNEGLLVLRHPPTETISDRAAAGIAREFRFISAIAGKAPVAEPIAFCEDKEMLGVPFSLTRFVEGEAITDTLPDGYGEGSATIDAIGFALVGALARVHVITPVPAGPGGIEKGEKFVSRQIKRWRDLRSRQAVRDLPQMDQLGSWLADHAPQPEAVRIVHCDYHLDNVLMDQSRPQVNAILDWEMATLADPLVDLGLVTAFWNRTESNSLGFSFVQQVSNSPAVVHRDELASRWSEATGLSTGNLAYYQAFSLWRLAAIVEGAYVLYRQGLVDGAYERGLERDVPLLLQEAERFARVQGMV